MMLKQSKILLLFVVFSLLTLLFSNFAYAATSATVAATVTVQNISVTVNPTTVAYGTIANNTSVGTNPTNTITATNNGNVAEDFTIKGQNTANWTLGATAAADQYVHRFCITSCATPPTSYTALTTNPQTLATNVTATTGSQTFDLYLTSPNPSSVYTQQSVDVTVMAAAH